MKDTNKLINKQRRDFLGMIGKAGISGSVLKASTLAGGLMATRFAHAQGGTKRVVFIYTPDGSPEGMWLPNGNQLAPSTLAFEGLQDLIHFREVYVVGSGHGLNRKCLGELRWGSGELDDTIDQQIARCISATMPYQHYMLGVQTAGGDSVSRLLGASVPVENSPAAAYQKLFGSAPPAGGAAEFLARKKSIMDVHHAALSELKGKLDGFEQAMLESHEASLNAIYKRLDDAANMEVSESCKSPAWNQNSPPYDTQGPIPDGDVGVFLHQAELQADIIVAALECGLTNVMTLQLGTDQAAWYGHDTAYTGDHHGSCHAAPIEDNAEMTNYLNRASAYLIRKLLERDDPAVPGTKLIDNTVVVQVSDMGDGRDHMPWNGPNLVATRMPGFKVGQATRSNQPPRDEAGAPVTGTNLEFLEGVVEGLGLSGFKGTGTGSKIWPCAGGVIDSAIVS